MIENERQLLAAEKEMCRLQYVKGFWPLHKIKQKYGEIADLEELISSLQAQLDEYRNLIYGEVTVDLAIIELIPELLVKARISAGLTQQELADLMGMNKQQINRLERTRYQTASHRTIARIKHVLEEAMNSEWNTLKNQLKELRAARTRKNSSDG